MTTTETPARTQAILFRVLADHLSFFPDLPQTNLTGPYEAHDGAVRLQVSGNTYGAAPVLAWAKTLAEPTIRIRPQSQEPDDRRIQVKATGDIDELTVTVWSVDDGALRPLYQRVDERGNAWTILTLDQLAEFVREPQAVTA
ncbi:hypothetical protein [Amycolatopsis pigmentata]|uniref:Uncharacterized protein n=1 Tax=Amycolatopsis pigmentata TaxID=450801 RepID=A0ABW5G3Y0_9PSEU